MKSAPQNDTGNPVQMVRANSACCFCIVVFGIVCIWSYPDVAFLGFAVASASVGWFVKYRLWRKRSSSSSAVVVSLIYLVPYVVVSKTIDITAHRLLLVQYLLLLIATVAGLSWIFPSKLEKTNEKKS
jgi:hypothetical protein